VRCVASSSLHKTDILNSTPNLGFMAIAPLLNAARAYFAIHQVGAGRHATNYPIFSRPMLPWCFRGRGSRREPFAKSLKSGAPDKIRTCDLCLRRATLCSLFWYTTTGRSASDDREPFPVGIFVSRLAKMRIALEARPCPVTGHAPYLRDAEARLEQSRNAIMPQVMEM
jgi:hypothetical protein